MPDADPKKERKVVLIKENIYQEIDAVTYKYINAQAPGTVQQQDALASDTEEHVDGAIITRLMEYRDAELRSLLTSVMKAELVGEANNDLELESNFEYIMQLDLEFRDADLKPLATLMHQYIVWGCLCDWYLEHGAGQAAAYERKLKDLENKINSMVHPVAFVKKPLQPFGPAGRMPFGR